MAFWVPALGMVRRSLFDARTAHMPLTQLCSQAVQGRVRRRDVVPGMQEAGWRSCWTMLLMEPFHVSGGQLMVAW